MGGTQTIGRHFAAKRLFASPMSAPTAVQCRYLNATSNLGQTAFSRRQVMAIWRRGRGGTGNGACCPRHQPTSATAGRPRATDMASNRLKYYRQIPTYTRQNFCFRPNTSTTTLLITLTACASGAILLQRGPLMAVITASGRPSLFCALLIARPDADNRRRPTSTRPEIATRTRTF